MFAFLFDSRHNDLDDFLYGPPCTSRVVQAIESLDPVPTTQLLWGDILTGFLAYDIQEIQTGPSTLGGSGSRVATTTSISYSGNQGLHLTLICDLAETLSDPPSTTVADQLLVNLGRSVIWAIVAPTLTLDQANAVDRQIRNFGPYLGMAVLDPGNPIHCQVMIEHMTAGVYLDGTGIHYRVEPGLPTADIEERQSVADSFGSLRSNRLAEWQDFRDSAPRLGSEQPMSERGTLSASRVAGKLTDTHRQRAAQAILEYFDTLPEGTKFSFIAKGDAGPEFIVQENKAKNYLLNRDHPEGGSKARFFIDTLGIEQDDWRFLADQLVSGVAKASLYRVSGSQFGYSHGALVAITGRNGKVVAVETGWQIPAEGPARLVTAYPADGSIRAELETSPSNVVDTGLLGDARWGAIFDLAHEAGLAASSATVPTPMVLEKYGTIWDGMCGFAWIQFSNARQPFAAWLRKHHDAYPSSPGVRMYSKTMEQSIDKNRAYCEAFANVVHANGIDCSSDSRLD